MPEPVSDPEQYRKRFQFLYPIDVSNRRYHLHAPDLVELRWQVYDTAIKRTLGYGRSPEDAVDVAIGVVEMRLHQPSDANEFNLRG